MGHELNKRALRLYGYGYDFDLIEQLGWVFQPDFPHFCFTGFEATHWLLVHSAAGDADGFLPFRFGVDGKKQEQLVQIHGTYVRYLLPFSLLVATVLAA